MNVEIMQLGFLALGFLVAAASIIVLSLVD
jgi:hypothetical protein